MSLADIVNRMLESVDDLTGQITRQVWGMPGYDDEHMLTTDLAARVLPNVKSVVAGLATDGPPEEDTLASAAEIGRSRALQGVPVDAVMRSWMAAERVLLDNLLVHAGAMSTEELRRAVHRLGELIGSLISRSVEEYRHTQSEVTTHYDRLSADLVARLSGERAAGPEEIERLARTIGSDPGLPHAAVVVGLPDAADTAAGLRVRRHLLAAVGGHTSARILIGSMDMRPLLLIPLPGGSMDALRTVLENGVRVPRGPDPILLGLSQHAAPLYAVGPICREARWAVEVAHRLGWSDRVVGLGDVAPEVLLLRNPDIAALLAARLKPLCDRPDLLRTLRVYLKCGMSARAAARALFVHQNTVPYRIRTIERLLGKNLDDVTALSDVILALRGLDLLAEADGDHATAPLEAT